MQTPALVLNSYMPLGGYVTSLSLSLLICTMRERITMPLVVPREMKEERKRGSLRRAVTSAGPFGCLTIRIWPPQHLSTRPKSASAIGTGSTPITAWPLPGRETNPADVAELEILAERAHDCVLLQPRGGWESYSKAKTSNFLEKEGLVSWTGSSAGY